MLAKRVVAVLAAGGAIVGCTSQSKTEDVAADRQYMSECGIAGAERYSGGTITVTIEGVDLEPPPQAMFPVTGLVSVEQRDESGVITFELVGGEAAGARACVAALMIDRERVGAYTLAVAPDVTK